jgi:hypothetical protein
LKLDESCISNSKLEISDWTDYRAGWPVQFEISSFEFEMQDSSNFKISPSLLVSDRREARGGSQALTRSSVGKRVV